MTTYEVLTGNVIALTDVFDRYATLAEGKDDNQYMEDYRAELRLLEGILEALRGEGGDEQFQGDWFPGCLIRDSYFAAYAQQLVEDCGDVPSNLPHYVEIDWEATARNIQTDYSVVRLGGTHYWYR